MKNISFVGLLFLIATESLSASDCPNQYTWMGGAANPWYKAGEGPYVCNTSVYAACNELAQTAGCGPGQKYVDCPVLSLCPLRSGDQYIGYDGYNCFYVSDFSCSASETLVFGVDGCPSCINCVDSAGSYTEVAYVMPANQDICYAGCAATSTNTFTADESGFRTQVQYTGQGCTGNEWVPENPNSNWLLWMDEYTAAQASAAKERAQRTASEFVEELDLVESAQDWSHYGQKGADAAQASADHASAYGDDSAQADAVSAQAHADKSKDASDQATSDAQTHKYQTETAADNADSAAAAASLGAGAVTLGGKTGAALDAFLYSLENQSILNDAFGDLGGCDGPCLSWVEGAEAKQDIAETEAQQAWSDAADAERTADESDGAVQDGAFDGDDDGSVEGGGMPQTGDEPETPQTSVAGPSDGFPVLDEVATANATMESFMNRISSTPIGSAVTSFNFTLASGQCDMGSVDVGMFGSVDMSVGCDLWEDVKPEIEIGASIFWLLVGVRVFLEA